MGFFYFITKISLMLAMVLLMVIPFGVEILTFKCDKAKKNSYKRFRIVIFSIVYIIAITIALYILKEFILWMETLRFVQWLVKKLALSARTVYCAKVIVAVLVNSIIGMLFVFLSKIVRIGIAKKNLIIPKKENGEFNWCQTAERAIIRFFCTETWFFVGKILGLLSVLLSVLYVLLFVVFQIPAMFGADWIPYKHISILFGAGYIYPTITLLGLLEMYLFLEGIKRVEAECPELLNDEITGKESAVDLNAIDEEIRKQFKDLYVCDVDLSESVRREIASSEHHEITRLIGQAVENDNRNPQKCKDIYLDCVDKLVGTDKSLLINGSFFSEFSMYFLRYLSMVIARGDNVIFVCNTDLQIDSVYDYLQKGLSQISSLFCKDFEKDAVDFDDPIWRIAKVSDEQDKINESYIDDSSILVASLNYLCSADFEGEHSKFIHLVDTVIFVDALSTVNKYSQQMSVFNMRLKHITKNNSNLAMNGGKDKSFNVRYMSHQIRYICFDDTRTPGLDRVLINMMSVGFESADVMNYNTSTIVRCYNYEGTPNMDGRRVSSRFLNSKEEISAVMNMALLCLAKGASNVTVFADNAIPYENFAESIAANMGQISIDVDESEIRLNKYFYNPDEYSVVIAVDSGNNLPAALRRYISIVSDKPTLVIVFSKPYMLRDYYINNLGKLWKSNQIARIPVEEGTKKDIARKILVKANAGGITVDEMLRLVSDIPQFDEFVEKRDINSVLIGVLEICGVTQLNRMDLFKMFEYSSSGCFDENGVYQREDKVMLRRRGELYKIINRRDMAVMSTSEGEIVLPIPRSRLTQSYISGQNLMHNGRIYNIKKIDTDSGKIYADLAVGGYNGEAYQYIQSREYRLEINFETIEHVYPTKHVVLERVEDEIAINDVYVSVFRTPMEVLTNGYYELDPCTFEVKSDMHDISNIELAKQTYRRYGRMTSPFYSSDSVMQETSLNANVNGALVMFIRLCGQFGPDVNKTMALASAMLNELLHSMFPSVADSIAVCPVLHGELSDEDSKKALKTQPRIVIGGKDELFSESDFGLVIIEDCADDLGVVSVLMSAGDDILNTLFSPVFDYLNWYMETNEKSDYLHFGLDHAPACFDFESLHKLSKILGDDQHDLEFVDIEPIIEYENCDFCAKRYTKADNNIKFVNDRKICKECAENIIGNNKRILNAHLERAKIYLESMYGITIDDDYDFCFESSVKISNTIKQNHSLVGRGSDIPLKSYIDDKKMVHIEYSVTSANISELLVRELTHIWQINHITDLEEDLLEGHIALVAIQYLKFLNYDSLVSSRTIYYESTTNISGMGYKKLVRELLANPQFANNPFAYMLKASGAGNELIIAPQPRLAAKGFFGLPYTPENMDRALDGNISYFYYSRLEEAQKAIYDTLLIAIKNHEEIVILNDSCVFDDVDKAVDSIRYDHPELFAFKTFSLCGNKASLFYGCTVEEAKALQKRIDEVVPKYLEGIDDSMSAYDAAIRVHVKVINSLDYDSIALNKQKKQGGPDKDKIDNLRTICGALLDGKAVCEGYARAMQYLLQKCGIECAEVVGHVRKENGEKDVPHAWNILKIDGEYYYLDTTWDDRSNTIQTVKMNNFGFNYFCITKDEMTRTRDIDLCPTEMPDCTATKANYYYHNDLVIDSYDIDKIKQIAQNAAERKNGSFTFKCKTKAVYAATMNRMCLVGKDCYEVLKAAAKIDKSINVASYSYNCNKSIWTITINFKYK